ncbi:MAG TPA: universal stress protein [Methyloprofundus sp.]|uniref:universal stress protein n=1 Tax=Methyloprofundus sp. TaxID=2020875 RepID=UPI0017E53207|nr:universal stress protein [Methyloprofundus sp.]HIG64924.1 universal stress protein [Methyloprofundus sp.]HIL77598.1 universal stress protein [Methylococcales bacterium]
MNNNLPEHTQKLVLACIDGSILTEAVCDYAVWITQRIDAPLKLLHTINHHHETAVTTDLSGNIGLGSQESLLEEISDLEQQQSKLKLQKGKLLLQAAKDRVIKAGISNPICSKRHGGLIESLIELEDNIRVLVLGVRGQVHDNQNNKIGAKLEVVIRSLHRPILIVNSSFQEPQRIMIAYDGSEAADKAIEMVAKSPLYKGLTCHLVCVNNNVANAENLLQQASKKLKTANELTLISASLTGKADLELCAYQEKHAIDLTIMGAFSHTRLREMLLGSFTVKMLLHTKKPLLLLR